jgi:DNA modification methylase
MKPIAVMACGMGHSTKRGDVVYDPFLGSGTTLIAAEQLGRTCYGMEISPQYCDVIVKRWENLTGEKATLQG